MTVILISPAEPAPLRAKLARRAHVVNSPSTEERGVDFAWRARGAWCGVQRKELTDLLASFRDGRLQRELGQMVDTVAHPMFVIERRPQWTGDGALIGERTQFTFAQWCGMIASFADRGIGVVQTDTMDQTVDAILAIRGWTEKASHRSLEQRPGPATTWGTANSRDWSIHLLQGFPGVGPGVAAAIVDHFGKMPLRWTVSEAELLEVPGIGPGRAEKMMGAL
jgi:ERCC4-type nuclease